MYFFVTCISTSSSTSDRTYKNEKYRYLTKNIRNEIYDVGKTKKMFSGIPGKQKQLKGELSVKI